MLSQRQNQPHNKMRQTIEISNPELKHPKRSYTHKNTHAWTQSKHVWTSLRSKTSSGNTRTIKTLSNQTSSNSKTQQKFRQNQYIKRHIKASEKTRSCAKTGSALSKIIKLNYTRKICNQTSTKSRQTSNHAPAAHTPKTLPKKLVKW